MTTPDPRPVPRISEAEVEGAVRQALRDGAVFLAVLAVVSVVVGWLTAGSEGVWGALLGVVLAAVFSGATVISVLKSAGAPPARTTAVVMGTWMVKIFVVFVALAVLGQLDFYNRVVLGLVLVAGVLGSALLDLRAVQRARIPYVGTAEQGPDRPQGTA